MRDEEQCFIMIKDSMHQKLNAYAFSKGHSKYLEQKSTKSREEIDFTMIIAEGFKSPMSRTGRITISRRVQ
jgi:hypothetical protein